MILLIYLTLLGFCVGSFLNVVIDRMKSDESIFFTRSHCDWCHRTLSWYELIPLLSFLFQRGKSHCCKKKLSYQYPLVELVTGISFFGIAKFFSSDIVLLAGALTIACALIVIVVSDLKYFLIPDSMLLLALGGLLLFLMRYSFQNLGYHLVAGVGAFLFLGLIFFITRGKGMGLGDVKFAFFLGTALGAPRAILALYLAFVSGAVVGILLYSEKRNNYEVNCHLDRFLLQDLLEVFFGILNLLHFFLFFDTK